MEPAVAAVAVGAAAFFFEHAKALCHESPTQALMLEELEEMLSIVVKYERIWKQRPDTQHLRHLREVHHFILDIVSTAKGTFYVGRRVAWLLSERYTQLLECSSKGIGLSQANNVQATAKEQLDMAACTSAEWAARKKHRKLLVSRGFRHDIRCSLCDLPAVTAPSVTLCCLHTGCVGPVRVPALCHAACRPRPTAG